MEYLIQYRINAPDVYYEKPVEFDFDGIKLIMYLKILNLISNGKKLHVIIDAESKEEAYNKAWAKLGDFNNRLIFLLGQPIIISHMEFIIENQARQKERKIFFRDIEMPGKQELFIGKIQAHLAFFQTDLDPEDKAAIGYYNEALRSKSPREQFRTLYLSLESLVGNEEAEVTCDICGNKLICPQCNKTKRYQRVPKKRIDDFLNKAGDKEFMLGKELSGSKLAKLRASFSHAQNKKLDISLSELNENIDSLSFLITRYIENKYGIPSFGRPIIEHGSAESVDYYRYRTNQVDEKFALDIPPLDDLKRRSANSRWIFEKSQDPEGS
jgi:hypothetical protein